MGKCTSTQRRMQVPAPAHTLPLPGRCSRAPSRWPLRGDSLGVRRRPSLERAPRVPRKPDGLPSPLSLQPSKSTNLAPLFQAGRGTPSGRRNEGDRAEQGVAGGARGGGAQPAAYVPSANRASCPAEVTMVRAAGGGSRRSSLLPYLRCPSGGAARRCRGKRRRRGKAGPRAGGRAEGGPSAWLPERAPRPALTALHCWAEMGRRLPSPLCHSGPGTADHSPAPMGVPP